MTDYRETIRELVRDFKAARDYRKLNPAQLLYCLAMLRALARDTLARVILVGWSDVDLRDVAEETADISENLNWEYIERLCDLCQNPVPGMYLVSCGLEQDAIYAETSRRLKTSKAGSQLLRLLGSKVSPNTLTDLRRGLKVERITTYEPERESDEDLRALADSAAWKTFTELGKALKVHLPQFRYPNSPLAKALPVEKKVSEQWEILNRSMFTTDFSLMQESFLPALEGKKISARVRQSLRDHWQSRDAQKRTGEEVPLAELDRTILRPSRSGIWRKKSERLEEEKKPDVSGPMFEVLKEAQRHKRWGPKAIEAFKYFLKGKTEQEAAKLAGITDKTFRNNIIRLRKSFSSEK